MCIRPLYIYPKGRTQCIFPRSQHSCLYIFFFKWPPVAILDVQRSLCIAFLTISDQYHNFYFCDFFYKMAAGGHFGYPKITFDRISGHFRSIRNFFLFIFYKMVVGAHIGCPKFTYDSIQFNFWPFQIDTQLFLLKFLTKWLTSAILDVRNSLSITFLGILDQYRIFCFIFLQNACRRPF